MIANDADLQRRINAVYFQICSGQRLHPEAEPLARKYVAGDTYPVLAREHGIPERFNTTLKSATSIVRNAILGNDNYRLGPVYPGWITRQDAESIAAAHAEERGRLSHEKRRGVHGLSKQDLGKAGLAGIVAQGKTAWSTAEKDDARELSMMEEYRWGRGIALTRIARELNRKYHDGEPVRTKYSMFHFFNDSK